MKIRVFILLTLSFCAFMVQPSFLSEQKQYERVRTAIKEKEDALPKNFKANKLRLSNLNILFVVYNDNTELNIYVRMTDQNYKI